MLLLLHEQDKMAPDWFHPEVNNNNIRLSSEAILLAILVFESGAISFYPASHFSVLQDGLPKGLMQCISANTFAL
uniref:Uncharacterized protein n=1 Tax=Suricata suricatta TaxID=37032 RepID=A0A673UJK5_SURSU